MTNKTIKLKSYRRKDIISKIIINFLVVIAALIALFPFYTLFVGSIKSYSERYFVWWPEHASFDSYKFVLFNQQIREDYNLSIIRSLWNTFKIVIPGVTVGLFMSTMSAYTFAKRKFPLKNLMFSVMMFSMMIPGTVTMISMYLIYAEIGWVNTPYPLMVPKMFGTIGLLFALRQYMYGIPNEILESARMDGANHMYCFLTIVLPLAKPVLIAHWILQFMQGYNNYQEALLYLIDESQYTIQLILPNFSQAVGLTDAPKQSAVTIIAMLPMFLLYTFSQKFFEQGIMTGSLKG